MNTMQLLQGTLDLLILRILELGPTWEEFAPSMRRILREGR
jgi:hypothetical protein